MFPPADAAPLGSITSSAPGYAQGLVKPDGQPAGLGGGVPEGPAGAARIAHTVRPAGSARTPHVRARYSTMYRPRPPRAETDAWAGCGLVGPPPSLTATSTEPLSTAQATWTLAPGNGLACR